MPRTWNFGYARQNTGEKYDDGVVTELSFGLHFEMWGGENAYYFTTVGAQDGSWNAKLVESVVDATGIPVQSWSVTPAVGRERGGLRNVEAERAVEQACIEAARRIGQYCDGATVKRLQAILFLFCNDMGGFAGDLDKLLQVDAVQSA